MTTRRRFLAAATGPFLLRATGGVTITSALAACGSRPPGLEVFVMWSGAELTAFRAVLKDFSKMYRVPVRVVPVGEQVNELLQARVDSGNPPDLAIVPLPGLIRDYASRGEVCSLEPQTLGENTPQRLRDLSTINGTGYGLWIKIAHKSLFWHRGDLLLTPSTWDDLVGLVRVLAGTGIRRPPLAIGAADGWVVSDWFENMLIAVGGGDVYDDLAEHTRAWGSVEVTRALAALADIWSVRNAFPGGARRALLTQYEESVAQVFATGQADLVFEGDFVSSVVGSVARDGADSARTFRFPPVTGNPPPLVVGGDVAARFTESDDAKDLLTWLADPESMRSWIAKGGFLSPDRRVPDGWYPKRAGEFARQVREQEAHVRFDLSDLVTGRLGGGQGRGMRRILQDFFGAVASGQDRSTAVAQAQKRLVTASEGQP